MHWYLAHANVDHYLGLLDGTELSLYRRNTIVQLLIAELNKASHGLEHLEFAESRAGNGRQRVDHIRQLRDALAFGSAEREQADRQLVNLENTQTLLEDFCHGLRKKISSREV